MKGIIYPGMLLCFLCIFGFESSKGLKDQKVPVKVRLVTTRGSIVLKLYDETPLHRDNFIKIIRDGVLDGVLFHRVIEEFMIQVGDMDTFARLNTEFEALAREYKGFETYKIPEAHREVYRTLGGTPHLDQNYTVFGEVVSGLTVVDTIAGVPTDSMDRPIRDVRIVKAEVLE